MRELELALEKAKASNPRLKFQEHLQLAVLARNSVPNRLGRSAFSIVFPYYRAPSLESFAPGFPIDKLIKDRYKCLE